MLIINLYRIKGFYSKYPTGLHKYVILKNAPAWSIMEVGKHCCFPPCRRLGEFILPWKYYKKWTRNVSSICICTLSHEMWLCSACSSSCLYTVVHFICHNFYLIGRENFLAVQYYIRQEQWDWYIISLSCALLSSLQSLVTLQPSSCRWGTLLLNTVVR